MAKLSGITTPSLTFDEGAAPSTPAASDVILYAKSDGLLYSKDDAGAETLVSGAAGGGGGFVEFGGVKLTGGSGDITTSSTTFVDLTGASVTITTAAVRCLVIASFNVINSNAGTSSFWDVDIDGTRYANTTNGIAQLSHANSNWHGAFTFMTDVLSAASHTFKLQWRVSANTGGVDNQTTTSPVIFQVIETNLTT